MSFVQTERRGREGSAREGRGVVLRLRRWVWLAALPCLVLLCGAAADRVPASNRAMETRLRAIYAGTDWKADPNKPVERAAYLKKVLGSGQLRPEQLMIVYPELTSEQLKAGDARGPLTTLAGMDRWMHSAGMQPPPAAEVQLRQLRALASLRLGEQENCLLMHGARSCVFPLRATAVQIGRAHV